MDKFTPFWSLLLPGFYKAFMDRTLNKANIPANLQIALNKSKELRKELNYVRDAGKSYLRQAKWIGFDRYVVYFFYI